MVGMGILIAVAGFAGMVGGGWMMDEDAGAGPPDFGPLASFFACCLMVAGFIAFAMGMMLTFPTP